MLDLSKEILTDISNAVRELQHSKCQCHGVTIWSASVPPEVSRRGPAPIMAYQWDMSRAIKNHALLFLKAQVRVNWIQGKKCEIVLD